MLKPFIFIIPIENNITHSLFIWLILKRFILLGIYLSAIGEKKQHVSIPPGLLDAFIWLTFDLSTNQLKSPYACLANKHGHPRIPPGF